MKKVKAIQKCIKLILLMTLLLGLLSGCSVLDQGYDKGVDDLKCDEYEDAVTDFKEAIENGHNLADSYEGLGIAYFELEKYEDARDAFLKAIDKKVDEDAVFCSFLGNSYMELGDGESALEYFEKALEDGDISDSLKQEVSFNMVVAYEKEDDMDGAKKQLASYMKSYPDDEEAKKEKDFLATQAPSSADKDSEPVTADTTSISE